MNRLARHARVPRAIRVASRLPSSSAHLGPAPALARQYADSRTRPPHLSGIDGIEPDETTAQLLNPRQDQRKMHLERYVQAEPLPEEPTLPQQGNKSVDRPKLNDVAPFAREKGGGAHKAGTEYPNLMVFDELLDSREIYRFPPSKKNPHKGKVTIRNMDSIFDAELKAQGVNTMAPEQLEFQESEEAEEEANISAMLPLNKTEQSLIYRFPLIVRRVTKQTGLGKIPRMYALVVVGNGDGLVGLGEAKDDDPLRAQVKAFAQAVHHMDYVERFEKRTIWTDMDTKLGSTKIFMRPRPVGFGLRCNPNLHQVLKAAGIKDISAKVWGSRNPINVIKAAFRMLQSGHAPLNMGDGIGGIGRKLARGSGARNKSEIERERGRKLLNLRT